MNRAPDLKMPFNGSVPTAYLIHGFLCSGKTTYAVRLANERNAVYVGLDDWYLKLFTDGSPTAHLDDALLDRLWGVLNQHWPKILTCGTDVVLDFGYWLRSRRDQARALASAVGARVELHWVQADDETAKMRCIGRWDPSTFVIDAESYEYLKGRYEPLARDEDHVRIDGMATAGSPVSRPESG
jgi:predicted kinase